MDHGSISNVTLSEWMSFLGLGKNWSNWRERKLLRGGRHNQWFSYFLINQKNYPCVLWKTQLPGIHHKNSDSESPKRDLATFFISPTDDFNVQIFKNHTSRFSGHFTWLLVTELELHGYDRLIIIYLLI